jgi:hypothetical protein
VSRRGGAPPAAERCAALLPQGRCRGRRLGDGEHCRKHERAVYLVRRATRPTDRERFINLPDDGVELVKDPAYEQRVRTWLADPKKLLDWRHTMARCQALADMLEERVRIVRMRGGGEAPPPLLAAISELRQLHSAIGRLEGRISDTTHVHVSLVNTFARNVVSVLTEFCPPERLAAALDRVRALQAAAVPGTNGR